MRSGSPFFSLNGLTLGTLIAGLITAAVHTGFIEVLIVDVVQRGGAPTTQPPPTVVSDTSASTSVTSTSTTAASTSTTERQTSSSPAPAEDESVDRSTSSTTTVATTEADGYIEVRDDTRALSVEVPVSWSEVDGSPLDLPSGSTAPQVTAAADIEDFRVSFEASGVQFVMFDGRLHPDGLIDLMKEGIGADNVCEPNSSREDYDDGLYHGRYDDLQCGDGRFVAIAASPEVGNLTLYVAVQLDGQDGSEALNRIIETFVVEQ